MKKNLSLLLLTLISFHTIAQQKRMVTFEDIAANTFAQKSVQNVNWMKDGAFYTALKDGNILKYRVTDGSVVETLFEGSTAPNTAIDAYNLSADEQQILLSTQREAIYRRSSKAVFYLYNLKTKTLKPLSSGGKQLNAQFSPDGKKVAFCRDNNLFVVDVATMKESQITKNGKHNALINGSTDWVYEEEFGFARAFWWSPDSQKLAFMTFDESHVREYNMQKWGELYPQDYRFKYPKAGEANAVVSVSVFNLRTAKTVLMDIGKETDIYIPRVMWTNDANVLSIRRMNRLQNRLDLLHAEVVTGKTKIILTETAPTYVDLEYNDDLTYLADGKTFLYASEKSGFKHLYLYDISGKELRQITSGNWEVADFLGIDEKKQTLYYLSTENSPLERHLYSIGLDGKNKRQQSEKGMNTAWFSPDFKYYILNNSASAHPLTVSLHEANGTKIKALEENTALKEKLVNFNLSPKEFFQFKTSENIELNGWMIKPFNFDPNKKYPVLMYVYGGPGSQMVTDTWADRDFYWYQILAQKGYLIACVDGRGTGARGKDFKHKTYANLGKLEVADQIEGAKYLGNQPYIDKSRIGIWGWSYGGYMSSLCILLGNDVFKTAIAGAPVTSWRFYDSIYTERYLQTPQLNAKGYDDYSPLTHADKLKGNYFIIHGTGDDNVHFQNSVAMSEALIKAGKVFQSFYYPNRTHGLTPGPNVRPHLYKMMTEFLERGL